MKRMKRFFALTLVMAMVLTGCQVPEGVEIPSGVSIPSDLSELTSEEMEQLESYLEDAEASVDVENEKDGEDAVNGDAQTGADATGEESTTGTDSAESVTGAGAEGVADAEQGTETVQSTVSLPSGRDWVHKILNVEEYRKAYKDLQAAYGDDWDGYVDHYLTHGLYEGRDEGKLFDPWAYAEAYPDVKAAYGDDANAIIQHYVNHGYYEGKTAGTAEGYVDMADKSSREYMMSHKVVERGPSTRLDALKAVADNALKYGRNHEGAKYPMMMTDGINIVTKEPAIWNRFSENKYYICNLYGMNNLLQMMEGLSAITGDETYKEAVYTQAQTFFNEDDFTDNNGLFYTGAHAIMDIMNGKHLTLWHETKDNQIPVEMYYRLDPEGFERYVTGYWNANIYDWSNLTMNRHGEYDKPLSSDAWSLSIDYDSNPWVVSGKIPFTATGDDMIMLAYYLSYKTGDPKYQVWGERMMDKYIAITDKNTGLTGSQYGVHLSEDGVLDRFLYNFSGADFVDINGTDYKTLTEADVAKVGETQNLNRFTVKSSQGFLPQVYVKLYEWTGQQKTYDMAKNNILGVVRYVYDPTRHVFKTPMSTNGTDFNPGEGNGPILVAPRGGYYAPEGSIFAESEAIQSNVLKAMIDVVHMLKDEDATERQEIWDAVRTWARYEDLGDLGTAMGENVNVNLNTNCSGTWYTLAAVSLYKYTKHPQYYDLAVKLADNILKNYYDPELGLFITNKKAAYTTYDTEEMYAVYCVEAMTQGMVDDINLTMAKGSIDLPHDGSGQLSDGEIFYSRSKVKVKKVDLGTELYSLVVDKDPNIEINDVYGHEDEKAIRQMVSLGLMEVDEVGKFNPEATVTRGEFIQMAVELFGFADATVPADFRFTDVTGTPYYEAVVKAENAGILDANMGATLFEGDRIITREEMASIIVKALQLTRTDLPWYVANALYRIEDKDDISAWAKDYVDIATNCHLMVERDGTVFEPKLDVTKAMVADALQNVCRYLTLNGVHQLNAVVTPQDADAQIVNWETSDATILEVDEQGRLYPLKAGSAIITARADGEFAQVEVIVAEKEDWMIKEIILNGEPLENFNSSILEYDVNLYLGTTQIESLTATSFTGAPVEITLPDALPGRVELKVEGTNVVYTIDVDNTLVEYTIDENFNHKINTSLLDINTGKYSWYVQGNSTRYNDYMKLIPKNWVRPDYDGYGCMRFPYKHERKDGAVYRAFLDDDYYYQLGPEADEMQLVIEVDLAVKNMNGKKNGYVISFQGSSGTSAIATFEINGDNEMKRKISSSKYNEGTVQTLEDERFYTLTLVVDKQNKTYNYYLDGKLLEKDVKVLHSGVQNFGKIHFEVKKEEEYCNAEMFFDGIRVYELQKCVVEERFEQVPQPTYSPKPTASPNPAWVEFPVNEIYDDYEVGTIAGDTAEGKGYAWQISGNVYPNLVKVVSKTDVDSTASASDNCLELPYSYGDGAGTFRLNLDQNLMYKLGEEASDDKSIVLEMDFAVAGEGRKNNGFDIRLSQLLGTGGYSSVVRFEVKNDTIGRFISSSVVKKDTLYPTTTGEFHHLKVVVNKQTKKFTYYINGNPVEVSGAPLHAAVPNIGTIYFGAPVESTEVQSSLYIDNLKLYVEETKPEPTAAPIPTLKPSEDIDPNATPSPYKVDLNFNGFALNSLIKEFEASPTYFWSTAGSVANGKVVAKTDIIAGAEEKDRCLVLASGTSKPGYYVLRLSDIIPLGEDVYNNSNLVVEMDVAVIGDDTSKSPIANFYFGQNSTNALENQLVTFSLERNGDKDQWVRIDNGTKHPGAFADRGAFATLKVVVNRGTNENCCSYYWNGQLVETGFKKDANWNATEFSELKFEVPKQASDVDVKLYVDNLRIYVEEADAVESPAPTVVPTVAPTIVPTEAPEATATPAATEEPTAEPSAVPTEAPTQAPPVDPNATPNPYKVNENYDTKGGSALTATAEEGYSWTLSEGAQDAVVVSKAEAVPGAGDTDYCVKLPATEGTNTYTLQLEEAIALENAALSNSNLVIELDVAIVGTTMVDKAMTIKLAEKGGSQLLRLDAMNKTVGGTAADRWMRIHSGRLSYVGPSIDKGGFGTLKIVVNQGGTSSSTSCSYYWNNQLVEETIYFNNNKELTKSASTSFKKYNNGSVTAFDMLTIEMPQLDAGEDIAVYIDNLKIYTQ